MRYQVPQFIDIEDKIIGPLTLKQFITYIVAVLLLIPLYLVADLSLFLTLALPVLGVAALFAHFQINGKSLLAALGSGINFFVRGNSYVWRRTATQAALPIRGPEFEEFSADLASAFLPVGRRTRASAIGVLVQQIDTQGNIVNQDETDPLITEQ